MRALETRSPPPVRFHSNRNPPIGTSKVTVNTSGSGDIVDEGASASFHSLPATTGILAELRIGPMPRQPVATVKCAGINVSAVDSPLDVFI